MGANTQKNYNLTSSRMFSFRDVPNQGGGGGAPLTYSKLCQWYQQTQPLRLSVSNRQ
jgi:hypothetical protein